MTEILNFSRFDGNASFAGSPVGFGGATDPSDVQGLKDAGFASVLNLRAASEQIAQLAHGPSRKAR